MFVNDAGADCGALGPAVVLAAVPPGEVRVPEADGGVLHVQGRLLAALHRLQAGQRRGERLAPSFSPFETGDFYVNQSQATGQSEDA